MLQARHAEELQAESVGDVGDVVEALQATMEVCRTSQLQFVQIAIQHTPQHLLMVIQSIAFRDREAGSVNNRGKPTDDGLRADRHSDRIGGGRSQGEGRGGRRGDRGGRGGRGGGDRHTRGLPQ